MTKLTIELPDEVYRRLAAEAEKAGRSVQEFAACRLADQDSREAIIDRMRARAAKYPPTTAEEFLRWRDEGRP